jgi:hypothetical protein
MQSWSFEDRDVPKPELGNEKNVVILTQFASAASMFTVFGFMPNRRLTHS